MLEPAITRDHTERMLSAFGVEVLRSKKAIALEGGQPLRGTAIEVPGDFSSAAFFMVAGCLASDSGVVLRGVGINPTRTGLIELLRKMGADIRYANAPIPAPRFAAHRHLAGRIDRRGPAPCRRSSRWPISRCGRAG